MDQNILKRIIGFILLVCLAIGLIIFAVVTTSAPMPEDVPKSIDWPETTGQHKAKLDDIIEDLDGRIMKNKSNKRVMKTTLDNGPVKDALKGIMDTAPDIEVPEAAHSTAKSLTTLKTTTTTTITTTRETPPPAPNYIVLLNNATEDASGKVYIDYEGQVGFVCNDDFDDNDARVVCREVGFKRGFAYKLLMSPGYEQYTRDEPILSNLMCSGNETYLYQCPYFSLDHNVTDSCSGFAAVLCYDDTPYQFRFANSLSADSGQIEMFVDGKWGVFCAIQTFDDVIADTVCREMNYTGGIALPRGTGGPATLTPVWVPWLSCYNNKTPKTIFDCELVLHTKNIPFDYHTHWNNRYRNMYYACIDTSYPYAPAVHCFNN